MKHTAHKRITHFKRKYKHIAAAFAGAILMSSALLPGIPASIAHAAVKSNVGNTQKAGTQKTELENQSAKQEGKKGKKISTGELKNTIREQLKKSKSAAAEKSKGDSKKTDGGKKQENNVPEQYEKVLDFTATAYAPGYLDNDQWGDKTYLGTTIRPGVVAVDPKVIPLGSRLYVQYPDGHGEYKVAEDTGGAIKGNRIDIAIMDRGQATDFGIKPVKVYVVSTPEKEA